MKSYNIPNYIRYKDDIKESNKNSYANNFESYSRDKLIVKFLPLVENIAKKFSTTQQASGVLDIMDLTQSGSIGLIQAVDKIEWATINESEDPEKTIKSFISKRIKGSIRRAIDINRGAIKIPEHKLNEIRNNPDNNKLVEMFFNSVFESIDTNSDASTDEYSIDRDLYRDQYEDKSKEYNIDILNAYLFSLLKKYLNNTEFEVLRLSYGLDCDKQSANNIADQLGIEGASAYVRISEIKKQAIKKLIDNVEPSQVLDYL
ncbi:MAG: sigma-70 family RNA polymerase sigma factor [Candidatus Fonsibacter sp.]|jgi:RNA polymerase sigma factor (sigma-70 family)